MSSDLLMCCRGVRSILLLPLVARCLETIDVCIWRLFVIMSIVVTVSGSVCMSCRCSSMGSMSVSSCRCCMFVSCVHPVAVLNAAFCMTYILLIPVS